MHKSEHINPVFDLHLQGFNFWAGLVALAVLRSGHHVALELSAPMDVEFDPELSHFYPATITQSRKAYADIQFLLKCSSFFPHCYFPKRVLFFQANSKPNYGLTATFDQLLRRDRETSSLPLKSEKFKDYAALSGSFKRGTLVFEYQFDRNRATMELLRKCVNEGALLTKPGEKIQANSHFKCQFFESKHYNVTIAGDYPYPNPVRVKMPYMDLLVYGLASGTCIQIHFTKRQSDEAVFILDVQSVIHKLNLNLPDNFAERLSEMYASQLSTGKIESSLEDVPLCDLRTNFNQFRQKIAGALGIKISLKQLFNEFPVKAMSGDNFRIIQNECDEKFDLAKQTGIDYRSFAHLFYRYRFNIDQLIDHAYELMNSERNPPKIWERVEKDFLEKEHKMLFERELD